MTDCMTYDDERRFAMLADLGFGAPYIAREFGRSEEWARRQAERLAVDLPRGRNVYPNYRARVEEMRPIEAVDYLLHILDHALPEPEEAEMRPLMRHGFRRQEARLLAAFVREPRRVMTKERAFAFIAVTSNRDLPLKSTVNMVVCRIRRRIKELGWPMTVETIKSVGYKFEVEEGFEIPA